MIAKYNRISLGLGIPGLVMQIAGRVGAEALGVFALPVVLLGTGLLLAGFAFYAKAKGRHPAWCLMAFLSLIGLVVLSCL